MVHRSFRSARITALLAAAVATLVWSAPAFAAGIGEEDVPSTSIVPAEGPSGPAPAKAPPPATSPAAPAESGVVTAPGAPTAKPHAHRVSSKSSVRAPEIIEPAQARLKVLEDAPVYSAPTKSSKHIEQLTRDKFVEVTGSTHYYLQVKLKSGQTGYIDPAAVELLKPTDKVFVLTRNALVLEKPNRWAKKLAEVHQGHNVHVVGLALNYMRIRMKSGLEGFIPITALE
jgi:hypothetical protein